MNRELLRMKLLNAYNNGYLDLADHDENVWGFFCTHKLMNEFKGLQYCLGVSTETIHKAEFDRVARELAQEILSSPLLQALA